MRLIKILILLILFICLIAFFSVNNEPLELLLPHDELIISISLSLYSIFFMFIGSIMGFCLKGNDKREHLIENKKLHEKVQYLKSQKKIYESELKIQNQIQKSQENL